MFQTEHPPLPCVLADEEVRFSIGLVHTAHAAHAGVAGGHRGFGLLDVADAKMPVAFEARGGALRALKYGEEHAFGHAARVHWTLAPWRGR